MRSTSARRLAACRSSSLSSVPNGSASSPVTFEAFLTLRDGSRAWKCTKRMPRMAQVRAKAWLLKRGAVVRVEDLGQVAANDCLAQDVLALTGVLDRLEASVNQQPGVVINDQEQPGPHRHGGLRVWHERADEHVGDPAGVRCFGLEPAEHLPRPGRQHLVTTGSCPMRASHHDDRVTTLTCLDVATELDRQRRESRPQHPCPGPEPAHPVPRGRMRHVDTGGCRSHPRHAAVTTSTTTPTLSTTSRSPTNTNDGTSACVTAHGEHRARASHNRRHRPATRTDRRYPDHRPIGARHDGQTARRITSPRPAAT